MCYGFRMRGKVHYTIDVPRGRQRFRELIVYVSRKCEDDPTFGAVKLNKILFHSDFRAYERFGEPLTGMGYFRLDKGPAPRALLPIRQELETERAIEVRKVQVGAWTQDRTHALRDAYLDHFSGDELRLIDEVVEELWGKSAEEVSEGSHGVAWATRANRESIPYEAVFLSDEEPTEADIREVKALNTQYGWGLHV